MSEDQNHLFPQWTLKLLRMLLKRRFMEEIEGDLEERFQDYLEINTPAKAKKLITTDAIKLIRPSLMKSIGGDQQLNQFGMLKHHFKVAWRLTLRQKLLSTIKIGSFAVGIAACILITLYIGYQSSYDSHLKEGDRVFRLVNQWSESGETGYWSNVHGPLKALLEENIPEMQLVARTVLWSWGDAGDNHFRLYSSTTNTYEEGFIHADPELLRILEIPLIMGNQVTALTEPNTMVISKEKAEKYFPNQNPIGEQVVLNNSRRSVYTISGVMEAFPENSHIQADFILTMEGRKWGPGTTGWCCTNYNVYTKLANGANKLEVEEKTAAMRNSLVIDQLRKDGQSGLEEMQQYQSYYLQPIGNVYLNPEKVFDDLKHGSSDLLWLFGFIAVIILLQACINFVNLSTSNAIKRAKEVGLRKVVGSFRSSLINQYLSESCFYTLMAVLVGLLLSWLCLPLFNHIADANMELPWTDPSFGLTLLGLGIVIGCLSGIYPAFYLSSFEPAEALKNKTTGSGKSSWIRNGMVVVQFATTIILIIAALVLQRQFDFYMNKSLGYDKDQVINIKGLETMTDSEKEVLKAELKKLPEVNDASISDYLPVEGGAIQNRGYWVAERRQSENGFEAAHWTIDEDYLQTMGIELVEGQNFTGTSADESGIIINKMMAEMLRVENPLGTELIDMFDEKRRVIGIVKNFHFETLFEEMGPLVFVSGLGKSTISVKTNTANMEEAISSISNLWDNVQPNQTIRYEFMDRRFEQMYDILKRAKTIFLVFSALSIVIACAGLFALSVFLIGQRTKEISVRKVLGAKISGLFWKLSVDFLKLVLVSIVLAVPIGWYAMDYFLEDLENRVNVGWEVCALAAIATVIITMVTISHEALKAALVNPSSQLRSE